MDDGAGFLGVTTSLMGRRWLGPDAPTARLAEALIQRADLPPALAQVLAQRGVAPDAVAAFLAPSLRDLLPDPLSLKDMDRAVDRISRALERHERIAIFADYDVDGGV